MTADLPLVERLQAAAAVAIADVGPTLEPDLARLQFVTIELELANGGEVVDAIVWTQRRAGVGRRS